MCADVPIRSVLIAIVVCWLGAADAQATWLSAIESPPGVFTLSVSTEQTFQAIEIGVDGDVAGGENVVPLHSVLQSRQFVSTTDGLRLLSPLGSPTTSGVYEPGINNTIDLTYGVTNPAPGEWIDGLDAASFLRFETRSEFALARVRLFSGGEAIASAKLALTPGRLVGDFNHDGSVDAADYTVWRDTLDSTVDLEADANGSGKVDATDHLHWRAMYGSGSVSPIASIPEPSAGWLAATIVCLRVNARRRTPTARW